MLFYCALTIYTGKMLRESVSGADLWYKIKKVRRTARDSHALIVIR